MAEREPRLGFCVLIFQAIYSLARPKNTVPPVLSVIIGYALANQSQMFGLPLFIACISIILLNGYATIQNDLIDLTIDADSGRSSALINHTIDTASLRLVNYVILLIALALPLLINDKTMFVYLALYVVGISLYNLPPFYASRRPLASITLLALLFSTLPIIIGLHVAGEQRVGRYALFLTVSFLLRFSISMLKDYKDYSGDKKHHKRTFLVGYGPVVTKRVTLLFSLIGSCGVWFYLLSHVQRNPQTITLNMAIFVGLVLAYKIRVGLGQDKASFGRNNQSFHRIIMYQNLIDVGALLCLYYF